MSLAARTRLGPYEILAPLGAGGMGEVYRARDERLGRSVAIKVLPAELTSDKARLKRFENEARAASSMNHPNIVTIHEVEQSGSTSFIVMELVEGKTLREMLASGPVPVRTLLGIAAQVADGLARAHASGIVHRDLKPENVMVTKDGLVKILDFGLAKLAQAEADGGQPVEAATVSEATRPGVVMGTVGYMSPEQASGHPVDFRSDQFSLGSILHEMATGKQPFKRPTAAQTLAAIIQEEPEPIATLNPKVPAPVRWIVERCLAKEPRQRYASSEDLARELTTLRDHLSEVSSGEAAGPALKRSRLLSRGLVAWAAAALFAVIAIVLLLQRPAAAPPLRRHAYLVPPDGMELTENSAPLAVSPDGQRIVFEAQNAEGRRALFQRAFAEAEAHQLPGTEGAAQPFWSPDSRMVGFFIGEQQQEDKIKRVGISDASPLVICNFNDPRGASWAADGTILFGAMNGPLHRVSAGGGKPIAVTHLDAARGEREHVFPHFLPDGRRFLFVAMLRDGSQALEAGSLDDSTTRFLGKVESIAVAYASPGYLLSVTAGRTLVAEPFDVDNLRLLGGRVAVAEEVMMYGGRLPAFSVSRTGVLAYQPRVRAAPHKNLVWFDRSGRQLETLATGKDPDNVVLSPDGTRLAIPVTDPRTDISDLWLYDFSRGTTTRLTFGSAGEGAIGAGWSAIGAVWSPDGRQIAFDSYRKGPSDIYLKSVGGTAPETPLLESDQVKWVNDWSPDGRFIVYGNVTGDGTWHLWALPMTGERKPFPVTQTAFHEEQGRFSPDGRLIAYQSDESGNYEVYVQAFPQAAERWQVSAGGARRPRWRRDGKELFYLSAAGQLMSVAIETRPVFKVSAPRPLFRFTTTALDYSSACISPPCVLSAYAAAPDGQRFLTVVSERKATVPPINIVFNWLPESKR